MTVTDMTRKTEDHPVTREPSRNTVAPAVDVFENDQEILLVADLPGVHHDSLRVHLENGELTLEGQWSTDLEGHPLAADFRPVDYLRRFAVPDGIDPGKVKARMKNGVVTIHLPKAEAFRPRQIPVKAG